MDPSKVDAILKCPTPKFSIEVRSFHGLAQYYRKFIKHFNVTCAPMLDTIKGGIKKRFHWTLKVDDGFEKLKNKIETQPIIFLPSFDKLFIVECNARNVGIEVVLSQERRLVTFYNEKLND